MRPTKFCPTLKNVSNTIVLVLSGNNTSKLEENLKTSTGMRERQPASRATVIKRLIPKSLKSYLELGAGFRSFSQTCSVGAIVDKAMKV